MRRAEARLPALASFPLSSLGASAAAQGMPPKGGAAGAGHGHCQQGGRAWYMGSSRSTCACSSALSLAAAATASASAAAAAPSPSRGRPSSAAAPGGGRSAALARGRASAGQLWKIYKLLRTGSGGLGAAATTSWALPSTGGSAWAAWVRCWPAPAPFTAELGAAARVGCEPDMPGGVARLPARPAPAPRRRGRPRPPPAPAGGATCAPARAGCAPQTFLGLTRGVAGRRHRASRLPATACLLPQALGDPAPALSLPACLPGEASFRRVSLLCEAAGRITLLRYRHGRGCSERPRAPGGERLAAPALVILVAVGVLRVRAQQPRALARRLPRALVLALQRLAHVPAAAGPSRSLSARCRRRHGVPLHTAGSAARAVLQGRARQPSGGVRGARALCMGAVGQHCGALRHCAQRAGWHDAAAGAEEVGMRAPGTNPAHPWHLRRPTTGAAAPLPSPLPWG